MRRALPFLAALILATPARAQVSSPRPVDAADEEEEAPQQPAKKKKKKVQEEEEEYPEVLPLGVPVPQKEKEPERPPELPPEPPAPKQPAAAVVPDAGPAAPAPVPEGKAAEGSAQLARPIELPSESYADILAHWAKRHTLLQNHDPRAAAGEEDEIRRIRTDLALGNLSELGAALIRSSEQARATRAPAEAVARCKLAIELAPNLPAAHLCLARAALAENILSVGTAFSGLTGAVGATFSDVRNRRAALADLAAVLLYGLALAGAALLVLLFLRSAPMLLHDFHHLFPAGAATWQTTMVLALLLASPFLFGLGRLGVLLVLAAGAALYLSRVEMVLAGAVLALAAGIPFLGGVVADATAFSGAVADVYQMAREGDSARAAERLERRVQGEKPRFEELFALAHLEKRRGKLDHALKLYEKAAGLRPHSAPVQNNLGNIALLKGDMAQAKLSYTRANELEPTLAAAHFNVSKAYFREANIPSGEVALKRARELDPEAIEAFSHIDDTKANRYLIDVVLSDAEITALNEPGEGSRVTAELQTRLAGSLPPPAPLAAPLALLALLSLARLGLARLKPSRPCEKCGRACCTRCSPELGPADVLCGQCLNVFVKKKSVDAAERIRKELAIARHQKRKFYLGRGASLALAGAGHVLGGKPLRGALFLAVVGLLAARIFFWDGFVRSVVPVSASVSALRVGLVAALALVVYAVSVRDLWRHGEEGIE